MRILHITWSLCLSVILFSASGHAGGCRVTHVETAKALASKELAIKIRDKILEVEAEMNSRGKTMHAVLVARAGQLLSGFDILEDNPEVPLEDHLVDLATKNPKKNSVRRELTVPGKLVYSHFGILLKRNNKADPTQREKDWVYATDLLAECDESSNRYGDSDIGFQTFDQFFWDTRILEKKNPKNSALLVIPSPEIQERLHHILHDAEIGKNGVHQPKYNAVSTPFIFRTMKERKAGVPAPPYYQLENQNSNQWPLEVFAAATRPIGQVTSRKDAQDVLMETNYRPSILLPRGPKNTSACALRKGPFWDASNLIDCKHQAFRPQKIYQLITVKSMVDYMTRNGFVARDIQNPSEIAIYEIGLEVTPEKMEEYQRLADFLDRIDRKQNPEKYANENDDNSGPKSNRSRP